MNEIIITKATIDDLDELFTNLKKNLEKFFLGEYTEKTIKRFLEKGYSKEALEKSIKEVNKLFIAKIDNKIVGLLLQMDKPGGGIAFTDWLMTDKEFQGRGIGSKLLEAWEKDSLESGAHCLILLTNDQKVKFYQNRGFTFMGRIEKGYYGDVDCYMYKPIQEPKEENYLK